MTKLTDTEQVILTAIARNNGTIPTRERSKSKADPRAYGAAIASLIKKGIIEPRGPAREGDYARDGQKLTLVAAEPAAKAPATSEPKDRKTRDGTKQAMIIELLKRPGGATLAEIVEATGWQAHTVRGAMAGALKKKMGLTVTSEKDEVRGRVYRVD
jgi:DNA-binding MarR family transcriptional regulator